MRTQNGLKVVVMLGFAIAVVALLCYARVDLGMTQEQINQTLGQWVAEISTLTMLVWSQIIVAFVAMLGYRVWRVRPDTDRHRECD